MLLNIKQTSYYIMDIITNNQQQQIIANIERFDIGDLEKLDNFIGNVNDSTSCVEI